MQVHGHSTTSKNKFINPLSSPDRANIPTYVITLPGVWTISGDLKGLKESKKEKKYLNESKKK